MKVMVIDQHTLFREGIIHLIKDQPDIQVVGKKLSEFDLAEQVLTDRPDIVLMSANLFEEGGREMMHTVLSENPEIAFIVLAHNENAELLLSVIRSGAKGYLNKNISEAALLKSLYAVERGEIAISRKMTSEIASELHKVSKKTLKTESEKLNKLTYRELEVLHLLATEASNYEIGRELFISNNTVRVHVHNILEKLQTKNRREAARFAKRWSISINGSQSSYRYREKIIREK